MLRTCCLTVLAGRLPAVLLSVAVGAGLGSAATPASAVRLPLRVEHVEASMHDAGPRATLMKYFRCSGGQATGYAGVAQGSPRWVALAAQLLPEADACHAEGLQDALGLAMQRTPQQVLPLVGRSAGLLAERICLPFISDEIAMSRQWAAVRRSRLAIESVHDDTLAAQRQACLSFIDTVEAGMASSRSVKPPAARPSRARAAQPAASGIASPASAAN